MDVLLEITEDGPDLVIEAGDLKLDAGLSSAVLLSILCDRRAGNDDGLPADEDPRGWPLETPGDRWGSRFWLTDRAKMLETTTLALARAAIEEGLRWLIDDDIAEKIVVRAELSEPERLFIELDVVRGRARRWPTVWQGLVTGAVTREVDGTEFRILFR